MDFYEKIKTFFAKHQNQIILASAFVLVFLSGFGVGKYSVKTMREKISTPNYYNTNTTKVQKTENPEVQKAVQLTGQGIVEGQTAGAVKTECKIKGNISSGGKKIYHIKGGAFYDRVVAEMCFNTEEEARTAGFIKSGR